MKTTQTNLTIQSKDLTRIAGIVGLILLIPVFGNLFIEGWNWGPLDFVFATIMFFSAGLGFTVVFKKCSNPTYQAIASVIIMTVFVLIWVELAVDAVSQLLDYLL